MTEVCERLPEAERVLLRRLGVFDGGCTLEAADQVCRQPDERPVAEPLQRLVEKSLVLLDDRGQRYRLPTPVREEARRELAHSADVQPVGDRHLEYFVQLAATARPQLAGPAQAAWLARIDAERKNILAAHEWAGRDPSLAPAGLRLANSLKLYWMNRGLLHLGLSVILEALHRPGADAPTADRAQGLFNAGQIRYFMGRHSEARRCLDASLELARQLGEPYVAAVLQPLGMAAIGEGDFVLARRCFDESLQLSQSRGDARSVAGALNSLGMLYRVQGQRDRARPLYEQVVRLCEEQGNDEAKATGLLNLAMVCGDLGFADDAARMLAEAIDIAVGLPSVPAGQAALDVCAGLACLDSDWLATARFAGAAEAQGSRSGVRRDAADAMFLEPKLNRARAMLGNGDFDAARREGAGLPLSAALAEAQAWLERASLSPFAARRADRRSRGGGDNWGQSQI